MTLSTAQKDRILAGAVTFLALLFILILLFVGKVGWNRDALAAFSIPEEGQDELFLEPDLIPLPDENYDALSDLPAAPVQGEPEPDVTPNTKVADVQPEPASAPPKQKVISQEKPSPVAVPKPKGEEEQKKATDAVAGKFNQNNGSVQGKFDSAGSNDAAAVGVAGILNGRKFLGCPSPDVTLSHKTVVKVSITVDAAGRVTSASAQGGASAAIRKACEQSALRARWSEKQGAPSTRGSITFTITPR